MVEAIKQTDVSVTPVVIPLPATEKPESAAKRAIGNAVVGSGFVTVSNVDELPAFHVDEIGIGEFLGRGGFYDVFEILHINLSDTLDRAHMPRADIERENVARKYLEKTCKKGVSHDEDAHYAIKCIRKVVVNDEVKYRTAVKDSVTEVYLLSNLSHKHILRIKGVVACDKGHTKKNTGQDAGYLILMERIYGTLTDTFIEWRYQSESICFKLSKKKRKNFLLLQLKLAYQLSEALKYLHNLNIMYRDIKQDNIGLNMKGDVKVFDFGLAKELRSFEKGGDGLYLLSIAGTLRYMSPEILRGERYNHKVDVYSYGVLLWEIFTLRKAFEGWSYKKLLAQAHTDKAVVDMKKKSVPPYVYSLIEKSISFDWKDRPEFETICDTIEHEINALKAASR